jgi:crotonobetainyl-CoA:carnitine CoA-transferase CaiB-like acyl-CoA transferase
MLCAAKFLNQAANHFRKRMSVKPLEGIRVLELARVLAGPWAGQLLADLGAEVTKIEKPGTGDDTRAWGPPFIEGSRGENLSAAYYHCCNRGKKSLSVDFHEEKGRAQIIALAAKSDILIENFKVGTLKKHGLDYESLKALNPRLIYCSITGFGQDGPYAARGGYDFMVQAMSGAMSITGEANGPPLKTGYATADLFTAMYAAAGILAALHKRHETGKGAHLDLSLLDCQMAALANQAMNYLVSGQSPMRMGNAHPNIVPYEAYPVRDGHIVIATGSDRQFLDLCDVLNAADLKSNPDYATNKDRVRHRAVLSPKIAEYTKRFGKHELLKALEKKTIPAGPINTIEEAFKDPQVIARGLRRDLPSADAKGGSIPTVRCPIVMDGEIMSAGSPSPKLSE